MLAAPKEILSNREKTQVIAIQHTTVEGLGLLVPVLRQAGIGVRLVAPDQPIDQRWLEGASGLIVLGGPMGVYETNQHPRLLSELKLIEGALRKRLPILGICLGSQLLASVLGSRVYKAAAIELGWLAVTRTPGAADDRLFAPLPQEFYALHWHGDIFEPPSGAVTLAHSQDTAQQAFSYDDRAWGLLFHLEADLEQVQSMCRAFPEELALAGVSTLTLLGATAYHERTARRLATSSFGRWAELVLSARGGVRRGTDREKL